jgi:hypothetical protein
MLVHYFLPICKSTCREKTGFEKAAFFQPCQEDVR